MRLRARTALLALAVAGGALLLAQAPLLLPLRAPLRDGLLRAAGTLAPPAAARDLPDAVILAIDTRSYHELPGWPWSRDVWARALGALDDAGAQAVVFDIDFSNPREGDPALAAALARSGRGVLAAISQAHWVGDERVEMDSYPVDALAQAAAAIGGSMAPLDPDGAIRSFSAVQQVRGEPYPSLARAALGLVSGVPPDLAPVHPQPIDVRRAMPEVPRVSLVALLEDRFDPAQLRDRVVFVGATAPVLQDLWYTPLGAGTPGVLLHAIQYRQHAASLEGQRSLRELGLAGNGLLGLLVSIAGASFALRSPRRRLLGLGGAGIVVLVLGLGAVIWRALLIDLLVPLLVLGGHYTLGLEQLRGRLGRMLLERERSIRAVLGVGRITAGTLGPEQGQAALRMLALAADAEAIQLLPVDTAGHIDEAGKLAWSQAGAVTSPRREVALAALSRREMSVRVRGDRALAYVPLLGAGHALGLLVAEYPREAPPGEDTLGMLHVIGSQLGLALINERLLGHLRDVMEQAQAASRAKTAFLGNMSHEIRTPMTALLGYLDLLEDPGMSGARRAQLISGIRAKGKLTLELLGDVLEFAQLQAGGVRPDYAPADPRELVRAVAEDLRGLADSGQLTLALDLSARVPAAIQTDARRLQRIVSIALRNAIAFSERGVIRVEVDAGDERLRVSVIDPGRGIPPELLDRVFEPFFQADASTTREHGGAGLGLALARHQAELLGGSIELESRPGEGTCFRLSLPLEPLRPDVLLDEEPPTRSGGIEVGTDALRVLVAEDSPDSAHIFEHVLTRAGFRVDVAANGLRACEQVRAAEDGDDAYAVILMDMDMPELDGYAATARLRRSGLEIPIIALTAHSLPDERQRCLASGCSDYASKPIGRDALVELVRRWAAHAKSG